MPSPLRQFKTSHQMTQLVALIYINIVGYFLVSGLTYSTILITGGYVAPFKTLPTQTGKETLYRARPLVKQVLKCCLAAH